MKDQFCVHDVQCGDTHEKWTATRLKNTSNSDYNPTTYHHTYNSIISYDCGLGKRFDKAGTFIRNVEYICDKRASGIHDIEVSRIRSLTNQTLTLWECNDNGFIFRDTGMITLL